MVRTHTYTAATETDSEVSTDGGEDEEEGVVTRTPHLTVVPEEEG